MQLLPEGGQRVQPGIHNCPDVAASAAVAARGSACKALQVAGLCGGFRARCVSQEWQGGLCLSSAQAKAVVQPRCVVFPLRFSCCQIGWVQGLHGWQAIMLLTAWHKLLPPEGDAAIAAIPRLHVNAGGIKEPHFCWQLFCWLTDLLEST